MVNINFQPDTSPVPSGYIKDIGAAYDDTRGYGWVRQDSLSTATHTPLDVRPNSRDRNRSGIDQRLDTLIHLQFPANVSSSTAVKTPAAWEYALANGTYNVTVSVGDQPGGGGIYDSQHTINVEGVNAINSFQGNSSQEYKQATVQVDVTDGKLTVDAIGGGNTKLNYVDINSASTGGAPEIDIQNLDGVPYSDRLAFNRIGSLTSPPSNGVHNVATLRVKNTGSDPLQLTGLPITGPWQLASNVALPTTVAAGGQLDIPVRFTATSGAVHNGTLTIQSNDADESNKVVQLSGFWQSVSEGGQEPDLYEIERIFGYTTTFTGTGQNLNKQGLVQAVGEEVLSPYWQRADSSQSVNVRQLAAFHTQGNTATVYWHNKGSNTTNTIFTHAGIDGQSLLPRKNGSTTEPAQGVFNPGTTFGFKVDGEWSDPTKNNQTADQNNGSPGPSGHHVRFWQVKDRQGQAIPNTWLMVMDYSGINYDYNDNVYLISNIKPESRQVLYRLDVGNSSSYTDTKGNVWSADTGQFTPSTAIAQNTGNVSIANTDDDPLYQTYRGNVGSTTPRTLTYNLPISTVGKVDVRLYYAEPYWGAPNKGPGGTGRRVFDVIAEGNTVSNNFDITAASGGALNATVIQVGGVNVTDGTLNLEFKAEVDYPAISAIEVLRA